MYGLEKHKLCFSFRLLKDSGIYFVVVFGGGGGGWLNAFRCVYVRPSCVSDHKNISLAFSTKFLNVAGGR